MLFLDIKVVLFFTTVDFIQLVFVAYSVSGTGSPAVRTMWLEVIPP